MPRPLPNKSKNGFTVDEVRRSTNKALKYRKSSITVTRKSNTGIKYQDRLMGGADIQDNNDLKADPEGTEEVSEEVTPAQKESSPKIEENAVPSGGPCCFCVSQKDGSTGDKKVDDMIKYIHQNLQEAGKALATLGENFEHDSKLIFADILGRIQQWIGIVQNKLDACKNDIEYLRKELIARICEIQNMRSEINELNEEREKLVKSQETSTSQQPISETIPELTQEQEQEGKEIDKITGPDVSVATVQQPDITYTNAGVQSMCGDGEKSRKVVELESELARLRKENERIIKERAEYENAIQRALLRGVSSLNVEALRVLRCPPIPCCTPCAPCPGSSNTTADPIVPCKNGRDCTMPSIPRFCKGNQRSCSAKNAGRGEGACTMRRACASPCCSAGTNRKSTGNSMVFLLHQGDTNNLCVTKDTAIPPVCGSPILKKIEIPPCPRFNRQ